MNEVLFPGLALMTILAITYAGLALLQSGSRREGENGSLQMEWWESD